MCHICLLSTLALVLLATAPRSYAELARLHHTWLWRGSEFQDLAPWPRVGTSCLADGSRTERAERK